MARANHRSAVKPRRPGRLVRRPVARNGRHPAANRATAATTGGQKIDYTRGRWPQAQSFAVKHHTYTDQVTSYFYPTVVLTQDADGKSLVDLDLSTYPNEEGKALFKYEVVRGTGQTVAAGTFATAPIVELTAPTPGDVADYTMFAWLDKNNNGLRDAGEDVKTLAAQQAKNVITIKAADNNKTYARPAAGQLIEFDVEVTVTSGGNPVAGAFLAQEEISHPPAPVSSPSVSDPKSTNNDGTTVLTVKIYSTVTPGTYEIRIRDFDRADDEGIIYTITITA